MSLWGWRVPFFIGCLIVPLLFWLRKSLAETGSVSRAKASSRHVGNSGIAGKNWKIVGIGHAAFDDDDGVFLSDHRVHADVWQRSVASDQPAEPVGDAVRGAVQF